MERRRQFTLQGLLLAVLAIGMALGVARVLNSEWLAVMMFVTPIAAVCIVTSCLAVGRVRPPGRPMLAVICVPSLWLLWLGTDPKFYYMGGAFFTMLLWVGIGTAYWVYSSTFIEKVRLPLPRTTRLGRHAGVLVPLTVTLLAACQVPLRIGFLTAWPGLAVLVEERERSGGMAADHRCGLYTISKRRRECHVPGRRIFSLANDSESGFVHSKNGIEDLCYNEGNKGHLFGNWYWMTED